MQFHSPSRRDFLKCSATALAVPALLPLSTWGQPAPSDRVNLALIGAGGRGSGLLNDAVRLPEAQFLAVSDCFRDRRESTRDKLNTYYKDNVVQAYDDFREVLARSDIDGVIIATPDHWHVPIAIAAARAGKAIYVEKPLGVSMEWAWELRRVAAEHKSVIQYGTQQRSAPQFRQACELVRNGYIGEISRVDAWCADISSQYAAFNVPQFGSTEPAPVPEGFDFDRWTGPSPERTYTVDRCTCYGTYHLYDYALGFIAGWGAHPLDIVQWGLGTDHTSPVQYSGTGSLPTQGLYDTIESWDAECVYESGVKLRFMGHRVAEPVVSAYRPWKDHGTTFFGSEGWISVDRGGILASNPDILKVEFKTGDSRLKETSSHMGDFVRCARTGEVPVSPLEAAIRSDTISHLCDIAIRLKRPVRWTPEKEQIIDDTEASALLSRPVRAPWDLHKDMVS